MQTSETNREKRFIVKMENGRGIVEYYRSLSVREQESDRREARLFTEEEARQQADFCMRHASAFSEAYFDEGKGRYVLIATVEPLSLD